MKYVFATIVVFLVCVQLSAQIGENGYSIRKIGPEEMITCPLGSYSSGLYLPGDNDRGKKHIRQADLFRDTLLNDVDPEFLPAIDFVLDFLENYFTSEVTINVGIEVDELGGSALAGARPAFVVENFDYAPYQDTEYPIALAEKILGEDINNPNSLDIIITINREFESWYLQPNDPTRIRPNEIDLASVLTHEMIHGLGFFESASVNEEGEGSLVGFQGRDHVVAYDRNIVNGGGQILYTDFVSPSVEMYNQFTSNDLFYRSETFEIQGIMPELYAPSEYVEGSSLSHLGEIYNTGRDALMTFAFGGGEVIYFPGDFTLNMMYDMGWDATRIIHEPALFSEDVDMPYDVLAEVEADSQFDPSSFKLHYSTDSFATVDNILEMTLDEMTEKYKATLPAPGIEQEYQYYFEIVDGRGIKRTRPGGGPDHFFTYNYGNDVEGPVIQDPIEVIVIVTDDSFPVQVNVVDNFSGVKDVSAIVKINGVVDTIGLRQSQVNNGQTYFEFYDYERTFIPTDIIEYRFLATDNSSNANSSIFPVDSFLKGNFVIDTFPPTLEHDPVATVTNFDKSFKIKVSTFDNFVGIDKVFGVFKINDNIPDTVQLTYAPTLFGEFYEGTFVFNREFRKDDIIQYSIFATDLAFNPNKSILPTEMEFYTISIIEIPDPVNAYFNDFNNATADFNGNGFIIGSVNGFSDDAIQSASHPYPEGGPGQVIDFTYELIKPVIVDDQESLIEFDEIALVEFGETGSRWPSDRFYDYVIVEARQLRGTEYFPLLDGYDCTAYADWRARYESQLNNQGISSATPTIDLLKHRTIDIRNKGDIVAGDTILVRFRLFSDNAAAGWGWLIDNLKIQNESTAVNDFVASSSISIFPNPVVNGELKVNIDTKQKAKEGQISIYTIRGAALFRQNYGPEINLNDITLDVDRLQQGLYLLEIILDRDKVVTKKFLIK